MPTPAERDQGFRPLDLLADKHWLEQFPEEDSEAFRLRNSKFVLGRINHLMTQFGPVNFYPADPNYPPDEVFEPGEHTLSTQVKTDQGTVQVDIVATYGDVPNVESLGQITGATLNFRMGEGKGAQASSLSVPRLDLRDPYDEVDVAKRQEEEAELIERAQRELPNAADLGKATHLLSGAIYDALLVSGVISNKDNPDVPQGGPIIVEAPRRTEPYSTAGKTLEILNDVPSDQWKPIEYQEVHGPALYVVSGFETPLTLTNKRFNVRLEHLSRISPDSMSVPDFLYSVPYRIRIVKEDDPAVHIDFSDFERASSSDFQSSSLFERLHRDLVESERVRIAESATQLRTEFNTAVWNTDNPEFYGNK